MSYNNTGNAYGTFSNPITKVGRVIYNSTADFYEIQKRKKGKRKGDTLTELMPATVAEYRGKNDISDENFSIQPHEVLVMTKSRKIKRSHNDTDFQTISCANGMLAKQHSDDVAGGSEKEKLVKRMRRVRQKLTFGGIANNRAQYDSHDTNRQESHFATQIGGLCTIMNTGKDMIKAGTLVMWDMPIDVSLQGEGVSVDEVTTNVNRKYDGLPRTKAVFPVNEYKIGMEIPTAQNCPALDRFLNAGKSVADHGEELFRIFDAHQRDVRERIIGRALSSAKPGQPFDIQLSHYMA